MPHITNPSADKGEVRLHYQDYGQGKPVVLIHGWPLSGRSWEAQILPLVEAGFRVITYDRRGFGDSSQPWSGYDYDTFAQDLEALLDALTLQDVTLVGFSMGGGEVARYLGLYGSKRISKAVFAAAVTPYLLKTDEHPEGPVTEQAIAEKDAAIRADRLVFLEKFTHDFFTPKGGKLAVSEAQRAYAYAIATLASPKGTLDCRHAFSRTDFRGDLRKIAIPTLVLHGDSDAIVPFEVSGHHTHQLVKDCELHLIKGGPHGCNVSHASEFNQALISFMKSS